MQVAGTLPARLDRPVPASLAAPVGGSPSREKEKSAGYEPGALHTYDPNRNGLCFMKPAPQPETGVGIGLSFLRNAFRILSSATF